MNDNSILMCFGITGNIVGNLLIDDFSSIQLSKAPLYKNLKIIDPI